MRLSPSEFYDMLEQTKKNLGESGSFISGYQLVRDVKLPKKENFTEAGFPVLVTMYDDSVFKINNEMLFEYEHSFEYDYSHKTGFCRLSIMDKNGNELMRLGSISPQQMSMNITCSPDNDKKYCVPVTAEINGHEVTVDIYHYIFSPVTPKSGEERKKNHIEYLIELFIENDDSDSSNTIVNEAFYWTVDTFKDPKAEAWLEKSKEMTYSDEGVTISIHIDDLYSTLSRHLHENPDEYDENGVLQLYDELIQEYSGSEGHTERSYRNEPELYSVEELICALHHYSFSKLSEDNKKEAAELLFSSLVNIESDTIKDYYKEISRELGKEFVLGAIYNALNISDVTGDDFKETWKSWIMNQQGIDMSDTFEPLPSRMRM